MKYGIFGAGQIVTGSNTYIETDQGSRFVVDCGLFQGTDEDQLNARDFPYDPSELDFVILTHAHIDHSGRLPKLVKEGFSGPIYTTKATAELAEIMLFDSAQIQASDAERENRKRARSGQEPIQALYTDEDVERTVQLFSTAFFQEIVSINDDIQVRFTDAGHILGAAIVEIWVQEGESQRKLVFSGDIGMPDHTLMEAPQAVREADTLFLESTYGNSKHKPFESAVDELMETITRVTQNGGTVIIPSFAVGRTQELIFEMNQYYEDHDIPEQERIPIYIDSPLASRATKVFQKNTAFLNDSAKERIARGDNIFQFDNLIYTESVDDSITLNSDRTPKVIISASGMATAGRVRHHLKHNLWDEKNAVIFVGYQAEGSLGRILLDGVDKVKLFGDWIQVKAKIFSMNGFSAHADRPTLLRWLEGFEEGPRQIVLVHGEENEMMPLAKELERLGYQVATPQLGDVLEEDIEEKADQVEMAPKVDLQDLRDNYRAIQVLLAELENRKEAQLDLEALTPERQQELQRTLHQLEASLLDFNMVTGS